MQMRKRNLVNLHVYASQTVKKKCMKPVMIRLKDLLRTVYYKPNGFTVRLFNIYNVYKFSARNTITCLPDLA